MNCPLSHVGVTKIELLRILRVRRLEIIRTTKENEFEAKKEIREHIEFEIEESLSFTPGIFYMCIVRYVERQKKGES
jgi:hypothetical protein